ncbi:MAG: tol-pal system protein YbgF [Candidatus Accumulibacter sp.]|jgi:tol-pal system protein YbgF|nr:tol-pal system protein YbgF [Accumulibacter sp.]
MSSRRLRFSSAIPAIALLLVVFGTPSAQAGLFNDDEARQQINELTARFDERITTLSNAQIELMNQIQSLRDENARLHGQVETLQYALESTEKRQQDFYVDLDERLRNLETRISAPPATTVADAEAILSGESDAPFFIEAPDDPGVAGAAGTPSDSAAEVQEYEAALNLFKADKIKESAAAFEAFAKAHPDSALAPNAYYWQGNALAAQRNCKRAIDVYRVVVARWPQNPRAAEALVGVASCQQELDDAKGARATMEAVLARYPESPAAATARQYLKK